MLTMEVTAGLSQDQLKNVQTDPSLLGVLSLLFLVMDLSSPGASFTLVVSSGAVQDQLKNVQQIQAL